MYQHTFRGSFVLVLFLVAAGCSPTLTPPRRDAGPGAGGTDAGPGGGRDATTPPPVDASFMECAADTVMAETGFAPVDIIWAIDTSGSMRGEADIVQSNINTFAAAIEASGIDYRVVVVSDPSYVVVPAPLGTDPTRFMYAPGGVSSSAALTELISRFSVYGSFLRPDAITHFVGVTDDESSLSGSDFRTTMEGLLGHSFTFHAIVSPPGSTHSLPLCFPPLPCDQDGCTGPNGDAADNGAQYWTLAAATGGRQFSICTPDWSSLFSDLISSIAVPTPLPCRYGLPTPPDGMTLDRMKVNVVYTPSSGGGERVIPYVTSFSGCSGEGWYYEDDSIVVCPATCSVLEADASGRVDIALGCETIII